MILKVDVSALKQTQWHELVLRFALGGLITAVAGMVAAKYGPAIGGLFLAFPAICPATATLIAKHEEQRKAEKGLHGSRRGELAAAVDAAGSVLGSLGLMAFAAIGWRLLRFQAAALVLAAATAAWAVGGAVAWVIWKKRVLHRVRG